MNFRDIRDNIVRDLQTLPLEKNPAQPDRDEIDRLESIVACWDECYVVHLAIFWRADRYHKITSPTKAEYQAMRDFDKIRRQACATN